MAYKWYKKYQYMYIARRIIREKYWTLFSEKTFETVEPDKSRVVVHFHICNGYYQDMFVPFSIIESRLKGGRK